MLFDKTYELFDISFSYKYPPKIIKPKTKKEKRNFCWGL